MRVGKRPLVNALASFRNNVQHTDMFVFERPRSDNLEIGTAFAAQGEDAGRVI